MIRIFNTYGPKMTPDDGRVVSNFIVQAIKGEDITLYGNGSQTRSFCYVDDLIEGMTGIMEQKESVGPVNLGNPNEFYYTPISRSSFGKNCDHFQNCRKTVARR